MISKIKLKILLLMTLKKIETQNDSSFLIFIMICNFDSVLSKAVLQIYLSKI